MDVVRDLAGVLPVMVIAQMLGTPVEDCGRFLQWSADISGVIGNPRLTIDVSVRAQSSVQAMVSLLQGIIDKRRDAPHQDDLIGSFLRAQESGETLDEEELLANCVMLLFAGHGTVTAMITITLLTLLNHPTEMRRVRDDPSLCSAAVDEALRFDSPCQMIRRVALADMEIGDKCISKGQLAWLMLGAANRDPARYADPDCFDIERRERRHLAYGAGIHYCLGAALSRIETETIVNTLLARLDNLRLEPGPLQWYDDPTARALKSFPVEFTAARRAAARHNSQAVDTPFLSGRHQ
jgi:cytochrome P450